MPKDDTPWTDDKNRGLRRDNIFNRRVDNMRSTAANMRAMMPTQNNLPSQSQSLSQTYLRMASLQQEQHDANAAPKEGAAEIQHSYREPPPPQPQPQAQFQSAPAATQTQFSHEDLERRALYDSATMTYNLRTMMRMLQHELHRTIQYQRPLSVVIVELNGLKTIELSFGLVAYSLAVSAAAIRLKDNCTEVDLIGRYSDTRFIIICPERSAQDVRHLCERIRLGFKTLTLHAQSQTVVPASIGFVSAEHGVQDVESMIAIADLGADSALERGENTICCAAEE